LRTTTILFPSARFSIEKVLPNRAMLFGTCREAGRPSDRDEAVAHRFYGLPERGEKRDIRGTIGSNLDPPSRGATPCWHSVHFAAGTYTLSAVTSSAFGTSVSNLTCWRVGFLSALARNVSLY
jgi:hypothetical protein